MNPADSYLDLIGDSLVTALWVLAVARMTRLLTVDRLTEFLRLWAVRISKQNEHGMAVYFSTCPWCVSMWVGLVSAPLLLWLLGQTMWLSPLFALAASWFAGVSANLLEGDDDDIEIVVDEE